MINHGRHNILGIEIDAVDYESTVADITEAAQTRRGFAVSALAVHGVMSGVLDARHGARLRSLERVVPDGQPVRWALKWLHGISLPDRVYGPNLMLKTLERAAQEGLPVFLYGGTEESLSRLVGQLQERFPALTIAGQQASRFRPLSAEAEAVVSQIRESGARITFVGTGCPRQETWAYHFRHRLEMPVLAVGAAFDFHSGTMPQAPPWMQKHGLEWLFRLSREPGRLWKRYLFLNPLYLFLLGLQRLGLKRFVNNDENLNPEPGEQELMG